MGFKVENKGLLTLIQGSQRIGYQQFGVPVSGVMDSYSSRIGNILVGNDEEEACLEILMIGPKLVFDKKTKVAITGANLEAKINNIEIAMWRSYEVNKGDVLTFGNIKSGCRSYVCFAGGIDVEEVMGSKSTYTKAMLGGFEGRALKEGDYIKLGECNIDYCSVLDKKYIPIWDNEVEIRIIKGPQDDKFENKEWEKLISSDYTVTNECDRMGYRLEGDAIKHIDGADIVSDGIAFGAIQIPGHGQPIIMMADRQTVGGYTKIGNVISIDLHKLSQTKPGDKIRFKEVDIYSAHSLLKDYEKKFEDIKSTISTHIVLSEKRYRININGVVYDTLIEYKGEESVAYNG